MKVEFDLELPDGVIDQAVEPELLRCAREQTVLKLYADQRITTGEAARALGKTRIEFLDFPRQHGGTFQVDLYEDDFRMIREWRDARASRPQ